MKNYGSCKNDWRGKANLDSYISSINSAIGTYCQKTVCVPVKRNSSPYKTGLGIKVKRLSFCISEIAPSGGD